MGSKRLPGKVMKKILNRPMLDLQIERVLHSKFIDKIIVATTNKLEDGVIYRFCLKNGYEVYRGASVDVYKRFSNVIKKYRPTNVIRLTADCPLIDFRIIDKVIKSHLDSNCDYSSNTLLRTFPRGLDVECFTSTSFTKMAQVLNLTDYDKEHVTSGFYKNPNIFKLNSIQNKKNLSKFRWTVDTNLDFKYVEVIFEKLYPIKNNFSTNDILEFIHEKNFFHFDS